MPMYYFHLIEDGRRSDDPDGSEFYSFEMAYLDTYRAVQDMWWEMVKQGKDPRGCSFEIVDADATCLAVVPFVEPLEKATHPAVGSDQDDSRASLAALLMGTRRRLVRTPPRVCSTASPQPEIANAAGGNRRSGNLPTGAAHLKP